MIDFDSRSVRFKLRPAVDLAEDRGCATDEFRALPELSGPPDIETRSLQFQLTSDAPSF